MIIAVRPQPAGHLELEPVGNQARQMVRESNQYDGTCIAYLQDSQDIEQFLSTLPNEAVEEIQQGWRVDINIDFWEFKHMVGGQSD